MSSPKLVCLSKLYDDDGMDLTDLDDLAMVKCALKGLESVVGKPASPNLRLTISKITTTTTTIIIINKKIKKREEMKEGNRTNIDASHPTNINFHFEEEK